MEQNIQNHRKMYKIMKCLMGNTTHRGITRIHSITGIPYAELVETLDWLCVNHMITIKLGSKNVLYFMTPPGKTFYQTIKFIVQADSEINGTPIDDNDENDEGVEETVENEVSDS